MRKYISTKLEKVRTKLEKMRTKLEKMRTKLEKMCPKLGKCVLNLKRCVQKFKNILLKTDHLPQKRPRIKPVKGLPDTHRISKIPAAVVKEQRFPFSEVRTRIGKPKKLPKRYCRSDPK